MNNSLKEKVRYWFEFLRLAHQTSDPFVQKSLGDSAGFYSAWGNYKQAKFNEWWKIHSSLFRPAEVLSVVKSGEVVTEDAFFVRVPYTYASSTVGKIVADMYDKELSKRSVGSRRMKKVYGGTFKLSREDYQVSQFHYYFIFVRDVYLPIFLTDPKAKTERYIKKSKEVFGKLKRKTTEKRRIPFTNAALNDDSISRLVRRYRQTAEKLLSNVAAGIFPGDYEETFIRNQSQIRAAQAVKNNANSTNKKLRGRPASMDFLSVSKKLRSSDYKDPQRKTRSDKGKKRGKQSID